MAVIDEIAKSGATPARKKAKTNAVKKSATPKKPSELEQFKDALNFGDDITFDYTQIMVEQSAANDSPLDAILSYGSAQFELNKFTKRAGFHRLPETRGELDVMIVFWRQLLSLSFSEQSERERKHFHSFGRNLWKIDFPDEIELTAFDLFYNQQYFSYKRHLKKFDVLTRIGKLVLEFEPNAELINPLRP